MCTIAQNLSIVPTIKGDTRRLSDPLLH